MTELEKLLSEAQTLLHTQDTTPTPDGGVAPASVSQERSGSYTPQYGETLASIAATCGLAIEQLMALNGIIDPECVTIGVPLRIG